MRAAAVAFTEGVRTGWRVRDLASWCRSTLIARGLLELDRPMSGTFHVTELGCGELVLSTSPHDLAAAEADTATRLLESARGRVLAALMGLIQRPADDRFITTAIYASRVQRVRQAGMGEAQWEVALKEGDSLSDWVLALFAADALTNRDVYNEQLSVCEHCGAVSWIDDPMLRYFCATHRNTTRSQLRMQAVRAAGEGEEG